MDTRLHVQDQHWLWRACQVHHGRIKLFLLHPRIRHHRRRQRHRRQHCRHRAQHYCIFEWSAISLDENEKLEYYYFKICNSQQNVAGVIFSNKADFLFFHFLFSKTRRVTKHICKRTRSKWLTARTMTHRAEQSNSRTEWTKFATVAGYTPTSFSVPRILLEWGKQSAIFGWQI